MSIIVASSFWDLFGEDASRILEILKKKGVKTIYSLEQGEQIHAWASGKWMEMRPQPWISSVCPVTSLYIQREYPELLPHLLPVLTPLECAVVYYRNHHRDTAPMAYLGPCLATAQRVWPKGEAYSVYALTFEGMFEQFPDIVRDEVAHTGYAYHHSSCKQEGCSSTQVSGTQEMVAALRMYKDRLQQGYPLTDYLELYNCEGGCKGEGGSILPDFGGNRKEIYQDLCLEDYVRSDFAYEKPKDAIVWDNQEAIFRLLHKYDEESRHIDCHACGYDSCMTMNRAIACGYNHKENCIQYMRDENLRLLLTDTVTGIPNTNAFMKKNSRSY